MTSWLVGLVSLASWSRSLLWAWFSKVLAPYTLKIVGNQGIKPWIDSVEFIGEIQRRVQMGKKQNLLSNLFLMYPRAPLSKIP